MTSLIGLEAIPEQVVVLFSHPGPVALLELLTVQQAVLDRAADYNAVFIAALTYSSLSR